MWGHNIKKLSLSREFANFYWFQRPWKASPLRRAHFPNIWLEIPRLVIFQVEAKLNHLCSSSKPQFIRQTSLAIVHTCTDWVNIMKKEENLVSDPITAERNLGSPNSSSNYPAYEAASLSGIARWKIQELLYLRVNPKGGWLEKSCCWCTEPRIVSSQSASRWRSLGWETFWLNSWPVDQLMTWCQILCTMRLQCVSKILTPHRMLQKTWLIA